MSPAASSRAPLASVSNTFEPTSEQVRFFDDHGYLCLNGLATPEEIAEIRNTVEDLFCRRAGENEGAYGDLIESTWRATGSTSPQILSPINYAPQLCKTKCFANALQVAKKLLGDEARFLLDLTILKEPKTGAGTPWHQDAAFRDPRFERRELTIWVPLQEVRVETGCLQFIPGSHRSPVLTHRPVNNDVASQALECTGSFDETSAVLCPLPIGGCTVHQSGTLHGSKPNVSDVPRFAYIMVFGSAPKPVKEPRAFPWQDQRVTLTQLRKQRWMRRGGVVITAWRRLRRGDVTDWHSAVYWLKRAIRTLRRGA